MAIRPLVFFSALAGGDYLLWNTSLSGGHEVVALLAGLALLPLLTACALLLVLTGARALLVARLSGRGARWRGMGWLRAPRALHRAQPPEPHSPGDTGSDQRGAARSGKLAA